MYPTARHLPFRRRIAGSAATVALATSVVAAQEPGNVYEEHEIDEIVVEAAPLSRTVSQLAQPTTVLGGDNLTRKQSTSIGETVSQELGVSSSYFGPVASRPVIRGQFGERVRVLTNGLDSLDASALSEDHAVSVNSILAERIEIVRGPATLLYGSGAAGGLVNVVDNRIMPAETDGAFGAASLGSDSATGKMSAAARIGFGAGPIMFHADYSRTDTDNVEIPGFAESALLRAIEEAEGGEEEEHAFGVVENTDSETESAAAAITFASESGYVGVSVTQHDSLYGVPGHAHEEEEPPGGGAEEEEIVRIDLEQTRVDVKGEYDFDGALQKVRFRLASNDYTHVELEGDEIGTLFDTRGFDGRLELRVRTGELAEGAFGAQFKRIDFDAVGEEAFVPGSETTQASVFAFHEWATPTGLAIQASGRIENQRISTTDFSEYSDVALGASLGVIWPLNERYTLSANFALSERHPNSTELYADGEHVATGRIERGAVALGRPELDRELSSNFDVSLHGDNENVEWTVSAFLNDVDDYILLAPTPAFEDGVQVFEYEQSDVELYGFEAEARVELFEMAAGHLHTRLFTDFVYGEEANGAYLPRLPPLRYGIGLHFTRDRFEAGVEAAFYDRQDKVAENELPTGDYTLLSAELSYAFSEPDLFLFVKGTNLADEDARQHTSPLKDTLPLPGRSLHLGVRYEF